MDDITLTAKLDDGTTLYVSPVHDQTYLEYIDEDNLGGSTGYFVSRERDHKFEILAKAASLDAAHELFSLLTVSKSGSA
jgi:hypothetical protein